MQAVNSRRHHKSIIDGSSSSWRTLPLYGRFSSIIRRQFCSKRRCGISLPISMCNRRHRSVEASSTADDPIQYRGVIRLCAWSPNTGHLYRLPLTDTYDLLTDPVG